MDVKGKRVLVVGMGKSGIASALFLAGQGARVAVSDTKSEEELHHEIPQLLDRGVGVEAGYHGERTFKEQELIVISPGVPYDVPQLVQARQAGIPVIGEIELAARYLKGHIIAITGSNGKTTTTALIGEIIDIARQVGLEKVEAEFIGEQAAAMKMFALLGFSQLLRLEDYVKDMQAIKHDYILMGLDLLTDEEYAGVGG